MILIHGVKNLVRTINNMKIVGVLSAFRRSQQNCLSNKHSKEHKQSRVPYLLILGLEEGSEDHQLLMDQVGIRRHRSQIRGMVSAKKVVSAEDGHQLHRAIKPKATMLTVEEPMILMVMVRTRSNLSIISQSSKITKANFSILALQKIQIQNKQQGIF